MGVTREGRWPFPLPKHTSKLDRLWLQSTPPGVIVYRLNAPGERGPKPLSKKGRRLR